MNVRIAQLFTFNAGTWYDNSLEMTEYTVKLWMVTQTYNPLEQNIAISRARHFIFDQLENTIFINSEDHAKCAEFSRAGLDITSLPGDPADQLVGIMLFHKLNAIMEERIKLIEIEISSSLGVIYLHGENETSEDLIQPDWWASSDLTHCDFNFVESEKVLAIPQTNAWRELGLAWPDAPVDNDTGNVVVFADFKQPNDTK
jgi:hypothetical protein